MKKLVFIFLALFSFSTVVFAQEEHSPQSRCINKSICLGMTFDEIKSLQQRNSIIIYNSVLSADEFPTLSSLRVHKINGFDVGVKTYTFDDVRLKTSVGLGFLDGVLFKLLLFITKNPAQNLRF